MVAGRCFFREDVGHLYPCEMENEETGPFSALYKTLFEKCAIIVLIAQGNLGRCLAGARALTGTVHISWA